MKRKLLFYLSLMAGVGVVLWACRRERFGSSDPNVVEPQMTVSEAREVFERQFSELPWALTKASGDKPVGMSPGDFTPLWSKARIGANREMDGADVPIDPTFYYVAVFDQMDEDGDTVLRAVNVTQKLVVKKWRNTDEYTASSYIASIVPTPEYYALHKNVGKDFQYAGTKGKFSGFVVYQALDGTPVAVTNYKNGNATRHEYFPRVTLENADSVGSVIDEVTGVVTYRAMSLPLLDDDIEKTYMTEEVTVTAKNTSSQNPWLIQITLTPRPVGLPTNFDPIDITYISPSGGGGGGPVPGGTTNNGKPKDFQDDCSGTMTNIKTASLNLLHIIQELPPYNDKKPDYDAFIKKIREQPTVEHGLRVNINGGSMHFAGDIVSMQGGDDFISMGYNDALGVIMHSHPQSHLTPPSPSDVMFLCGALNDYSESPLQAGFVFVGDDIYCLQVTDPAKARQFGKDNPLLEGSSDFNPDSPAGKAWSDAAGWVSSFSDANERYCAAMAYVLGKCDAGITLLRMRAGASTFEAYGAVEGSKGQYYPTRCR